MRPSACESLCGANHHSGWHLPDSELEGRMVAETDRLLNQQLAGWLAQHERQSLDHTSALTDRGGEQTEMKVFQGEGGNVGRRVLH